MIIPAMLFIISTTAFVGVCVFFTHSPEPAVLLFALLYGSFVIKSVWLIAVSADIAERQRKMSGGSDP